MNLDHVYKSAKVNFGLRISVNTKHSFITTAEHILITGLSRRLITVYGVDA